MQPASRCRTGCHSDGETDKTVQPRGEGGLLRVRCILEFTKVQAKTIDVINLVILGIITGAGRQ